jgi:putative ABC transport system substrate-binding protein
MTTRREFLMAGGTGLCVLAAPVSSLAQQKGKFWRVGFLSARRRPDSLDVDYYGAFPQRLRDLGYVEGKNISIEWRYAEGQYERLPAMAAELVQLKVDVMMALGPPAIVAAQKATTTIPIVIVSSIDPVGAGFVKSLARPGGNITGLSNLAGDISSKHLEILLVMVPKLSRVAVLVNPDNSAHATILKNVQAAAKDAGMRVLPLKAKTPGEIENAFSMMAREHAGALIVALDPLFIQQELQIAAQAVKHRLPSIFANREYAEAGGLMSYGQNQADIYRRAADYVDRIFKGAKPGELPVEQPTKLELVINRKTAKAIGLAIPQELLLRADRVIE